MSYVQENLLPNESVVYQTKIHWIVYAPAAIAMIIAIAIMQNHMLSAAFAFLAFAMLIRALILAYYTEFAVTNQRVIMKTGWISRIAIEVRHDKIESITMAQGIVGRMLDYGTLYVQGTGSGTTPITNIDHPLEFRKAALAAMEQYQR